MPLFGKVDKGLQNPINLLLRRNNRHQEKCYVHLCTICMKDIRGLQGRRHVKNSTVTHCLSDLLLLGRRISSPSVVLIIIFSARSVSKYGINMNDMPSGDLSEMPTVGCRKTSPLAEIITS